jgi:hypothetical protein
MDESILSPTPERFKRGQVEFLDKTIADDHGRISRPHRAVDILASMERRGSITPEMRQAGEDFRAQFQRAQLDPLKAPDLAAPYVANRTYGNPGNKIEGARRRVWQAVLSVGGLSTASGSCLWDVVGWEKTLKQWSFEQVKQGRRIKEHEAAGVLIGALGMLENYFAKNT